MTTVGAIVVALVFMLVNFVRDRLKPLFNSILFDTISDVARDVTLIVFTVTLVLLVHYFFGENWDINLNGICLALSVFALTWVVLAVIFVTTGQSIV